MRRRSSLLPVALAAVLALPAGAQADDRTITNGSVAAHVDAARITLTNGIVARHWLPDRLLTTSVERVGGVRFVGGADDFALQIDGVMVPSSLMRQAEVRADPIDGGVRVTWRLLVPDAAEVTRTVEAYEGIAGFRSQTIVRALAPLSLAWYSLDEVGVDLPVSSTIHAFRAGADWRFDDGWEPFSIGDPRTGDWRVERSAGPGEPNVASGEWLSLATEGDERLAIVMERRNYSSSMMAYRDGVAQAFVDLSRDVVYWGPFEESIHTENPLPPGDAGAPHAVRTPAAGARTRVVLPGRPLALEPAFTLLAANADLEAWEFYSYLTERRLTPYPKAVTFNTNNVDANVISTGAKDDVNHERFLSLARAAREMGVETFIFDDGWQARSGDWCPDSLACPEPRWDGSPTSKFRPRFLDDRFQAVGEVLAGDPDDPSDDMTLGLWMTPMEFHPSSDAFGTNPQWACAPVGHGTAALSVVDPDSGSNDAGIGVWNPLAYGVHPDDGRPARLVDYMADRVERAIVEYGARYFKFDFLVWIDCAGVEPVDLYAYHDAFVEMVDGLQAKHPHVTFQIDETNDYRMFPFESVSRGPSWFQNGTPRSPQILHNVWALAPYVPGFSLGQQSGSHNGERAEVGVDRTMAPALTSHITFWTAIDTALTSDERARIKRWTDFYKAHRETLATFTYPLLDDPLLEGWTALQPWNPEAQRGWLLAYRQASDDDTRVIALRGVDETRTFTLTRHEPGEATTTPMGTVTGAELRAGIPVTIADHRGYAIINVEPSA